MLSSALRKELVSAQNDPKFTLWDLVPFEDQVLNNQLGGDISRYDSLERDCHLYAVLSKLQLGVVAHEWEVVPASKALRDIKAADRVRDQLLTAVVPDSDRLKDKLKLESGSAQGNDFDAASLHLLDALLKGCAFAETMWTSENKEIRLGELRGKPQYRFRFALPNVPSAISSPYKLGQINQPKSTKGLAEKDGYLIKLLTADNQFDGEFIPDKKIVCHNFGSKIGNPNGLGFGSKLWFPVQFKKELLKFWLYGADKFSNPTPYGKHPPGIVDLSPLTTALEELSQGGWFALSEEFEIALLESARAGNADFFEKFLMYLDLEISKCIAGETLTTQLGAQGSLAATQVHADIRLERIKAIADGLSSTLNKTICKWITELNDPLANPPTIWRIIDAGQDLNARADRDKKLSEATGRPLDIYYVEKTYGVKFGAALPVSKPVVSNDDNPTDEANNPNKPGESDAEDSEENESKPEAKTESEFREWNAEARNKLASGAIKGAFAGPDQSYPIADSKDAADAWNLAGHANNPDAVRRKIISICKNYEFDLPKAAQDWIDSYESSLSNFEEIKLNPVLETERRKAAFKAFKESGSLYAQWVHNSVDNQSRPTHKALDGFVFRADDPGLAAIFPPCAKNCRCTIKPLTSVYPETKLTKVDNDLIKQVAEYLDYPPGNDWSV